MARLRAEALTSRRRQDVDRALARTRQVTPIGQHGTPVFALCHGGAGNALLFLQAYQVRGEAELLNVVRETADFMLNYAVEHEGTYLSGVSVSGKGEPDESMMIGEAGIGSFYLRLRDPFNTPCVLAPAVPANRAGQAPRQKMDRATMERTLLRKCFPRTLKLANTLKMTIPSDPGSMDRLVPTNRDGLADEEANRLAEICNLEQKKLSLEMDLNPVLVSFKQRYYYEPSLAFLQVAEKEQLAARLSLAEEVTLLAHDTNWLDPQQKFDQDQHFMLLVTTSRGVVEQSISELTFDLLTAFAKPVAMSMAIAAVVTDYEVPSEQLTQVRTALLTQTRSALRAGLLRVLGH